MARALGRRPQRRNSSSNPLSSSGRSRLGRWPAPSIVARRAPGISAGELLGHRLDVLEVLGADDDERRCADLSEPRLGRDLRPDRLHLAFHGQLLLVGAERHRLRQLAHLGGGVGGEPHPRLLRGGRREVAALDRLLFLGEARLRRLRPAPGSEACADQDEPLDEIGPCRRELDRDPAAEGAADDSRRRVEERGGVVDVRDRPGLQRSVAEAGQVGCERAVAGSLERLDLRLPHPAVGDPRVQEQDVTHRRRAAGAARRRSPGRSSPRPRA